MAGLNSWMPPVIWLAESRTGLSNRIESTKHCFKQALYTHDLPDPDLLIRTSGETRISNFLLWQLAYTELYFTPTLWPDFRRREALVALIEYQRRERRFGRVFSTVSS